MPRGEPTKAVRLPIWLVEHLEPQATAADCTVGELITKRMAPPTASHRAVPALATRCDCPTPALSKVVTNLCTTCKRMR